MENKTALEVIASHFNYDDDEFNGFAKKDAAQIMAILKSQGFRITKNPVEGGGTDTQGPTWTPQRPTVNGWYWCRYPSQTDGSFFEIKRVDGEMCWEVGDDFVPIQNLTLEWWGPVPILNPFGDDSNPGINPVQEGAK